MRVERVELSSHPWEGYIIAVIRYPHVSGAEDGIRTHDLLVTNELLYQLSHFGVLGRSLRIVQTIQLF